LKVNDMNWTDLIGPMMKLGAPLLGQALGGPLGAAAGKIAEEAFGAAEVTPQAVNDAVTRAAPEAASLSAQAAEERWLAALAEIGKAQIMQTGESMRAEAASSDPLQRCWRPLYALELSLIECPAFALTLLHALWTGHEVGINGFGLVSGLLIAYFAARFGVLGVYVGGRTREKQAALTGEAIPSLVGEVVKAIKGRR
jgi:Holin of 3TMs, for gene-transfer release